jgi:N-methylhydantoinase A
MEAAVVARLRAAGIREDEIRVERSVDMRYAGQGFEVTAPVSVGRLDPPLVARITESFLDTYRDRYGQAERDQALEIVSWRVGARGPLPRVALEPAPRAGALRAALTGRRRAYFNGFRETPVYDRLRLGASTTLRGPAIVEERESTLVVPPGARLVIDRWGTAIVKL